MKLTDDIIIKIAHEAGIEPAALKAVTLVESSGDGFLPDGRAKILFEGHIFWRQLKLKGIDPTKYYRQNPGILYENWDKTKYVGGEGEYNRLEVAMIINKEAALMSASYGLFQIMGFNYKYCGFDTVQLMVSAMNRGYEDQLRAGINFLRSQKLIDFTKAHNWLAFASRYNGPKFAENQYDKKLEAAYQKSLNLNKV
jgi:hypothetical protein